MQTTVRLDPHSKAILQSHFSSLGNALYFIAKGITEFKEHKGLIASTDPGQDPPVSKAHNPDLLTFEDLEEIRACVNAKLDRHRGPDAEVAPLVQALRKLERLLLPDAPGSPF
jgi:hypothetical protein